MDYRIRMRNLREDSDKTQQEIATILETSQTMYARYERGANEMPIRHLIRLAQYYNVSTDYFLGLTKEKTPFPKSLFHSLLFAHVVTSPYKLSQICL